jgi:hypothetical protein
MIALWIAAKRSSLSPPRRYSPLRPHFIPQGNPMLSRGNELDAWDRDHFFHPSTHMGARARGESPNRIMAGGEGVSVVDAKGKKSVDAFAGLYCVNVGYGRRLCENVGWVRILMD